MAEREKADAPRETRASAPKAGDPPRLGESTTMDYWYDMRVDDGSGVLTLTTYAYGLELDVRDNSSDTSKGWGDLVAETAPLIQADIDAYGIAP